MNKEKTKFGVLEDIYCINVFLAVFYNVLQNSALKVVINLPGAINWFFIVVCVVLVFSKNIYKRDLFPLIGIAVGALSFFMSGSRVVVTLMAFAVATRGFDYFKILRTFKYAIVTSILLVAFLDFLNMIPKVKEYHRGDSVDSVRSTFGFTHPNVFSMFVLAGVCSHYFCYSRKVTLLQLIPCAVAFVFTFFFAKSNTVSLVLILIAIFLLFSVFRRFNSFIVAHASLFKKLVVLIAIVFFAGIIYLSVNFTKLSFTNDLGQTAVARFHLANIAIKNYGFSLLGQKVEFHNSLNYSVINYNYFTIDCLYILLAVRDGILASLFFWLSLLYSAAVMIKKRYLIATAIIISLMVFSVMESGLSFVCFGFIFAAPYAKAPDRKDITENLKDIAREKSRRFKRTIAVNNYKPLQDI